MKSPAFLATSTLLLALGCENNLARETIAPQMDLLPAGTSVSGHANWFNAAGESVSRTFHGNMEDGIVEGNFVQHITALNGEKRVNKSTVDCIRLLSETEAVVSGTVEENITPSVIGQTQIFRIQDNGEGEGDPPDQISPLVFRQPALGIDCSNLTPVPATSAIEAGNVQVKP